MVIEITKDVLEYIYSYNLHEFRRLVYLIKKNIGESIYELNPSRNFIYLNFDACEFILNICNDSMEISKYNDNLQNILSSVSTFKRLKIVLPNSSNDKFEIEYESEKVVKLLEECPEVIIENMNDQDIYEKIIRMKFEIRQIKNKFKCIFGNGGQVPQLVEKKIREKEVCIVITDHDQKYYEESNSSSTPSKVKNLFDENMPDILGDHIIISYKNIEGLIPYKYVLNDLKCKKRKAFDELYKIQKNKEWLKYFDFKKGLKKNLKSSGNVVMNSKIWWNSQFCWGGTKDIIDLLNELQEDEILSTGIPNYDFNEIPYKDFLEKSSKEQFKEYNRIGKIIYPWIIINDYIVE